MQARCHGQFTTVNVIDWPCVDGGCAESIEPGLPVKVPVTFAVPLNVPVSDQIDRHPRLKK